MLSLSVSEGLPSNRAPRPERAPRQQLLWSWGPLSTFRSMRWASRFPRFRVWRLARPWMSSLDSRNSINPGPKEVAESSACGGTANWGNTGNTNHPDLLATCERIAAQEIVPVSSLRRIMWMDGRLDSQSCCDVSESHIILKSLSSYFSGACLNSQMWPLLCHCPLATNTRYGHPRRDVMNCFTSTQTMTI